MEGETEMVEGVKMIKIEGERKRQHKRGVSSPPQTREGGKVIFLSCFLHLFVHRAEHIHATNTQTNKRTGAAAMHVNELSMEQWRLFTLMNINEGTKIEG